MRKENRTMNRKTLIRHREKGSGGVETMKQAKQILTGILSVFMSVSLMASSVYAEQTDPSETDPVLTEIQESESLEEDTEVQEEEAPENKEEEIPEDGRQESEDTGKDETVIPVEAIRAKPESVSLYLNEGRNTEEVWVLFTPENPSDPFLTWSIEDSSIADLKELSLNQARVTAKKAGSTVIHVVEESGLTLDIPVTVHAEEYVPAESLAFPVWRKSLHVGESWDSGLIVEPANATRSSFTWTVSGENPEAVTAEDGVITGVSEGSAGVTVKDPSGESATIFIDVTGSKYRIIPDQETITVKVNEKKQITGRVVDPNGKTVAERLLFKFFGDAPEYAEITENGDVSGVKPGVTEAFAYYKAEQDDSNYARIEIIVEEGEPVKPSIVLEKSTLELMEGTWEQLNFTVTPESEKENVVWSSSNEKVADVTEYGAVRGLSAGTAVITASLGSGKDRISVSCQVTVRKSTAITDITLPQEMNGFVGRSFRIPVGIVPSDTDQKIVFACSDPEVLTVDEAGVVTGLRKGTAVVTVSAAANPSIQASVKITIRENPVEEIRFERTNDSIAVGASRKLHPVILPSSATEAHITYNSSKPGYLSVSEDGTVTAHKAGSAVVTAMADNGVSAEVTFTITEKEGIVIHLSDGPFVYTGRAIKPEVTVTDGTVVLEEKTDYTVAYKNNIKAGTALVTVSLKGNYEKSGTKTFTISPLDISSEEIIVQKMTLAEAKTLKINPTVTWKETKLKSGTDYTVESINRDSGTYVIKGKGNFTGERVEHFTVVPAASVSIPVSKLRITTRTVAKQFGLDLNFAKDILSAVTIKNGRTVLAAESFKIDDIHNCNAAGTCTFTISAKDGDSTYAGSRTVSVKISGTPLSKVKLSIGTVVYDGKKKTLADAGFSLSLGGVELRELDDYVILNDTYTKNVDKGKASVTVMGVGSFVGTRTVSFSILPSTGKIEADRIHCDPTVFYQKGGAVPYTAIDGLSAGKDYKVSFTNNRKAGTTGTAVFTFLGNYAGTEAVRRDFEILPQSLDGVGMILQANDITVSGKKGKYTTKVTITDSNGKKLAAGTDYDKNLKYYRADPIRPLGREDIVTAGETLYVGVTGKGNYEAQEILIPFRVLEAKRNLSSAKVSLVNKKYYSLGPVTLSGGDLRVVLNGRALTEGTDYEILEETYVNNTRAGTARVTLHGINGYGGYKTVSFKINKYSTLNQ